MNWKSLLLCAGVLFAASAGLVACGDEEDAPCETDADCTSEEFCLGPDGARECEQLCTKLGSSEECNRDGEVCIQIEDPRGGATVCDPAKIVAACTTDADCDGGVCSEGSCISPTECSADKDCATGEACQAGTCVATGGNQSCENTSECIDQTAYCADLTSGSECLDVSCGSDLNNCSRCKLGANGGERSSNGPVIFFPEQSGNCTQDAKQCLPGAAPEVCTFTFFGFDAQNDLPTSGLNNQVRVISSSGKELTVFGTSSTQQGANRRYTFKACFPETSSGNIGTAVLLRDQANNPSNSLCVDGRL